MAKPVLDERKLKQLMETDCHAYQKELLRPWDGMESDMQDLVALLAEEGEVRIIENVEYSDDGEVSIRLPDWIVALRCHYIAKHGKKRGLAVHLKVMALFSQHIMPGERPQSSRVIPVEHLVSKRH